MKAIVNGKILLPEGMAEGRVLLYDRQIVGFSSGTEGAEEVLDARGLYVSPGFVDTHIHGYGGDDASDGSAQGVVRMARQLVRNGVTSFLPTTMTLPLPALDRALDAVREARQMTIAPGFDGAEILGCHAEGPFISPDKKGAQREEDILPPDAAWVLRHRDIIRVVTFAPEMPGAEAFARQVRGQSDICLSIGHTGADYDLCRRAEAWGASRYTHTFNAMQGLHHRAPGTVGAALGGDAWCELIADTIHVHPGLFPLIQRAAARRVVLITDCTRAGGLEDGEYTLGGQPIVLQNGACRLRDGTLAGSVLRMNQAVYHYWHQGRMPLWQAVRAASLNAAASVGVADRKGSLEKGKNADMLLLDEGLGVRAAWRMGRLLFAQTDGAAEKP